MYLYFTFWLKRLPPEAKVMPTKRHSQKYQLYKNIENIKHYDISKK